MSNVLQEYGGLPVFPASGYKGINKLGYISTEFMKAFLSQDPDGDFDVMAERAIIAANTLIKKLKHANI